MPHTTRVFDSGRSVSSPMWRQPLRLSGGLRAALREGYSGRSLLRDLSAGMVVGIVAIPLSMALAMATGVPPQCGLYTAIVAGAITAFLGGSRVQVSGPTAAFIVILSPIVAQHGLGGLMLASLMAGLILFLFGLARMGRLIEYIPYPVTCGFTSGIAVVIAVLQIKDFLGLQIADMPESFFEKAAAIAGAVPSLSLADALLGGGALAGLILFPRLTRKVPGPLVILTAASLVGALLPHVLPGAEVATVRSQFQFVTAGVTGQGIPQGLPSFQWPWQWPGVEGHALTLSWPLVQALIPSAFAIAILAAIESLLSAVIADGMQGTKHDPDAELMALGIANMACPFLGGFAATGAIARTAANVRFGARSPIAAITHALVVMVAVAAAAPLLGFLPISALAALLLLVAWNMAEARHFVYVARIAPRSDAFVMLVCFGLTIVFDMVVAVTAGMMLASLLFIRRMSEVATVKLVSTDSMAFPSGLAPGVVVYELAGPLFFGAAEKAMSSLSVVGGAIQTVVFDFRQVPMMDVTGLINLESALNKLKSRGIHAVFGGVNPQLLQILARAGWKDAPDRPPMFQSFDEALAYVAPSGQGTTPGPVVEATAS